MFIAFVCASNVLFSSLFHVCVRVAVRLCVCTYIVIDAVDHCRLPQVRSYTHCVHTV